VQWRTRRLRARQAELEATVADRTAEVRAKNEQLAQQADDLQALDKAKSRFFANLSHEFRTPLTLILGPVRTLQDAIRSSERSLNDAAVARQLSMVERNAFRLLRMVRQILDLAREDADMLRLRARPTDIARSVQRITQTFVPLAERHGLTLAAESSDAASDPTAPPVYLDDELFKQILSNLLSNAIKFTPNGGRIDVHVTMLDDAAELSVRDTGEGIPEAVQDRIFERFVQADSSSTRSHEGIGIGLALTHTLVDLHGGTLRLAESSAEGTTFVARFPRGRDHLTDDQVTGAGTPQAVITPDADIDISRDPLGNDTQNDPPRPTAAPNAAPDADRDPDVPLVLVVDDNADVRAYVRSVLEPTFRVIEAANGAEGLRRARKRLPDVVLADVMMPEMDGLAMTTRLREHPETAALPVIMLTARADSDDEVEGLKAGATDYVIKPFDAQVLQMRVRGTLDYQRRLRAQLLSEAADATPDDATDAAAEDADASDFATQAEAIIHRRLPDPAFGVEELADALGIGRTTLYRRANAADLPSPAAWIRQRRLERAATLLADDAGTVSEVAYAVGFQNLAHFSEQFLDHFDRRPSAYAEADTQGTYVGERR
jgi:signal transduction histidine kinase/DNA-binding NarL/FixJ family response regulator